MKTALFLAALCAAAPAYAGDCPMDGIEKPGFTYSSDAAVYATPEAIDFGRTVYDGWDLVHGTLRVHHWGGLGTSTVHATDRFDVTGVPPGTDVVVEVRMYVGGWAATDGCGGTGCAGLVTGTITTPEQTVSQYGIGATFGGIAGFSFWVVSNVSLVAGAPVPITFALEGKRSPGGSHSADGLGTYTFHGLPEGAKIVSCQGYLDPSVPALPSSWGSIKAAYR